ncbi:hypothetical protein ACNKHS_23020 [Shigella flexneri]
MSFGLRNVTDKVKALAWNVPC